ncbi:hypothetical protein T265_00364 [Opisthorchis viverrini]|uniref:Uncharacterized protein n=1 Tax=Opisthorchis viverrini TaxID=6198 RepID=A0A075AJT2_OPIVI|nr:hypothetical protein T265_00364 [Opisthorchis viverrini]KER33929.1 hypothetical protein T265_00364 [Opisthorchis viverrini]
MISQLQQEVQRLWAENRNMCELVHNRCGTPVRPENLNMNKPSVKSQGVGPSEQDTKMAAVTEEMLEQYRMENENLRMLVSEKAYCKNEHSDYERLKEKNQMLCQELSELRWNLWICRQHATTVSSKSIRACVLHFSQLDARKPNSPPVYNKLHGSLLPILRPTSKMRSKSYRPPAVHTYEGRHAEYQKKIQLPSLVPKPSSHIKPEYAINRFQHGKFSGRHARFAETQKPPGERYSGMKEAPGNLKPSSYANRKVKLI